jgi:hypothetical protein
LVTFFESLYEEKEKAGVESRRWAMTHRTLTRAAIERSVSNAGSDTMDEWTGITFHVPVNNGSATKNPEADLSRILPSGPMQDAIGRFTSVLNLAQ